MRSNKHTEAGQSHFRYTQQFPQRTSVSLTTIITTLALTAAFGPFAAAQSDAPASPAVQAASAIEEIQVTARKRGNESIQDIPVAITAITGDTLERMGVSDFDDFAYQVPGLTFNDSGPGEKRYIVRGIQSAGQEQVSVYYDEVPMAGVQSSTSDSGSQTTDLKIYDFERVEVLRGPQGTTFGANSQSGTVRYITNKPNLTEIEGSFRGDLSYTEHGSENWGAYAMFNMPIIADQLAARFVVYDGRDSGYIDNVRLGFNDINWVETLGIRGMLRWAPSDDITVDAMIWHQERDSGGDFRYHPYDTIFDNSLTRAQKVALSSDQGGRDNVSELAQFQTGEFAVGDYTYTGKPDDQTIYSLTMNWGLSWSDMVATYSHYNRDFDYKFDSSWILYFLGVRPATPTDPGVRADLFPAMTDQQQSIKQDAVEIRFNSTNDGPFQWLGGVFWRERQSEFQSYVPVVDPDTGLPFDPGTDPGEIQPPTPGAGIEGCLPCVFGRVADKDIEELAFFGELSWAFTERFEATVGARWFKVDQSDTGLTVFPFALFPPNPQLPSYNQFDEDRVIPKFQLAFLPNENMTVYALASQGYRLGGTNNQGIVAIPPFFESDDLWNLELGYKSMLFDNRVIFNTALFHILWDNMQVAAQVPNGAFGYIANAGKAEVTGLEAEIFASPDENWNLTFGAGWLPKRELTEDQNPTEILAPAKEGDKIPRIPALTLNATAQYSFALPVEGWSGYARGEGFYKSGSSTEFRPFSISDTGVVSSPNQRDQDSYQVFNLRFGAVAEEMQSEFSLFFDNIFNADGDVFISAANGQPTSKLTTRPRTIGISWTQRFGGGAGTSSPAPAPLPASAPAAAPPPNPDLDGDGVPNERDKCPNTRPGAVVDLDGCEVEAVIALDNVHFDFDQATLRPEAMTILDKAANLLQTQDKVVVEVAGHTDNAGSEEYNQGLSERRANTVKAYLEGKGITATRLTARGYGEAQPVASNDTDEGRALNRRVELIVLER